MNGGGRPINSYDVGLTYFKHNEIYSSDGGITFWWVCSEFTTVHPGCSSRMDDVIVWNTLRWGIYNYESSNMTIDGFTDIGDLAQVKSHGVFSLQTAFAVSDYAQNNLVLRNLKFHNLSYIDGGFSNLGQPDDGREGTILIENSDFSNYNAEWVNCTVGSTNGKDIRRSHLTFRNVRFRKPAGAPSTWASLNFGLDACSGGATSWDNNKPLWNTIENYNSAPGVSGPSFDVYPTFQPAPSTCNRSTAYPEIKGTVCLRAGGMGGPLPLPDLTGWPKYLPTNGQLTLNYPSNYDVRFHWTLTPNAGGTPVYGSMMRAGALGRAASADFTTSNSARLADYALSPGPYVVSVQAVDSNGNLSGMASANITLVDADFSALRVFPNPWRNDRNAVASITVDHLPLSSRIKIFTVSGHWVTDVPLTTDPTVAKWLLTNDGGDRVASGIYLYLITAGDNAQKTTGKVVVIK